MRAGAVVQVRGHGPVEVDFEGLGEDGWVARGLDEGDEDFVVGLNGDRGLVRGVGGDRGCGGGGAVRAEGAVEADGFHAVAEEEVIGGGGGVVGEALDGGPVGMAGKGGREVEVEDLVGRCLAG